MTTAQLDHLRAIDAHLTALLALAAKRTPGEWRNVGANFYSSGRNVGACFYSGINGLALVENAAFIAACAGRAEAGWRSTKAAIEDIPPLIDQLRQCKIAFQRQGWSTCQLDGILAAHGTILESILTAWPRELLTLP